MTELLSVKSLSVTFGGLAALNNVTLTVKQGTIHGLIGPNGAGKSTMVNALTGVVRLSGGVVLLEGRSVAGLPTHAIAQGGVARTFQNICLFAGMTVLENTMVGAHRHFSASLFGLLRRSSRARGEEADVHERAMRELAFVGLQGKESSMATALAYGHQRRLEIARALMLKPVLLLLDEPIAGMNAVEKDEIATLIRSVRDRGITVLIIEHDMQVIRQLCDRLTVLHHGKQLADGTVQEVFANPVVKEAYLGRAA